MLKYIKSAIIILSPRLNLTNDFKGRVAQAYTTCVSKAESCKNRWDHLKMRLGISLIIIFLSSSCMAAECVVLLHGFGRSSSSLKKINNKLEEHGYRTVNINYPSRNYHIFQLAEQFVLPRIEKEIETCSKVHFVGYSMGGIITRYILANHRPKNLGRVILLASPNQGTEVVNSLGKYLWFQTIFGPGVLDVSVNSPFLKSLPSTVDYETGVISGNFSVNPISSLFLIPGDDDGTVSVENTKINGMKDHITIRSSHFMLLYNDEVAEEIEYFIRNGSFRHKINLID